MTNTNPIDQYLSEIEFEELSFNELSIEKITSLKSKEGIVIETSTTNLWINRKLEAMEFLNTLTVMENVNTFDLRDSFGVVLWTGPAEEMIDYVSGFLNPEEPVMLP